MTRTIVITGASDGIGLECASQLAATGDHLVLVGRNPAKVTAAVARLGHESPQAQVDSYVCDFTSLADVRRLATELLAACPRIDVLINNAGTVSAKRVLTVDGYETTFAVNHLAGFLLTELLLDRIVASGPARIVNTASLSHRQASMDFEDLGFERGYQIMRSYGRSKLANVLYTRDLAVRLKDSDVTVNCLHPGTVATNIWSGAPAFLAPLLSLGKKLFMITAAEGGETLTYLATNAEVAGKTGGYYEKNRLKTPSKLARDEALGRRLDAVSRTMTGLS